jgi:PIN domain nuclease of toxin-antitoxin system
VSVFDTSALLAILRDEPGGSVAHGHLDSEARCSAAIWSELAQKLPQLGVYWPEAREVLISLGVAVEPVTAADAEAAAVLWVKGEGLSLADRLCIALSNRVGEKIITCDSAWLGRPRVVLVR